MKKYEVNFKSIQEIEFEEDKEPKTIFGKKLKNYINNLKDTQDGSMTDIKSYVAANVGVESRTIDNWLSGQEPKITPVVKFAILSGTSLDELLMDSESTIDETFAKRTGLTDVSGKSIIDLNRHIMWNNEFKHTMEKLQLNARTSDAMANTYIHQTKRQEFPLWKSRDLITVTFSQLLNYCVQKDTDIMEILTQLSDILNLLKDWKDRKDRSDVIKKLNKYEVVNEDAYIDFKDSINDDEKLKNELDAVEKSVSKIITKIFKEFILDEFRNFPSGKSEKKSTSN